MTVRQAERSGIVMAKVAGWFLEEFRLRTWKKRSHPAAIKTCHAWCVRVVRAHDMKESRPAHTPENFGLPSGMRGIDWPASRCAAPRDTIRRRETRPLTVDTL